jgi:hypothetical protein
VRRRGWTCSGCGAAGGTPSCAHCQTRRRVAAFRLRQGPQHFAVESCWACGDRVPESRLTLLHAKRSKLVACSVRCQRALRQEIRRRRLGGMYYSMPPVRFEDGSRLPWSPCSSIDCPASRTALRALRKTSRASPSEALLAFMATVPAPKICNRCGLAGQLEFGLTRRLRAASRGPIRI